MQREYRFTFRTCVHQWVYDDTLYDFQLDLLWPINLERVIYIEWSETSSTHLVQRPMYLVDRTPLPPTHIYFRSLLFIFQRGSLLLFSKYSELYRRGTISTWNLALEKSMWHFFLRLTPSANYCLFFVDCFPPCHASDLNSFSYLGLIRSFDHCVFSVTCIITFFCLLSDFLKMPL